jgi:hypothetical protein
VSALRRNFRSRLYVREKMRICTLTSMCLAALGTVSVLTHPPDTSSTAAAKEKTYTRGDVVRSLR